MAAEKASEARNARIAVVLRSVYLNACQRVARPSRQSGWVERSEPHQEPSNDRWGSLGLDPPYAMPSSVKEGDVTVIVKGNWPRIGVQLETERPVADGQRRARLLATQIDRLCPLRLQSLRQRDGQRAAVAGLLPHATSVPGLPAGSAPNAVTNTPGRESVRPSSAMGSVPPGLWASATSSGTRPPRS